MPQSVPGSSHRRVCGSAASALAPSSTPWFQVDSSSALAAICCRQSCKHTPRPDSEHPLGSGCVMICRLIWPTAAFLATDSSSGWIVASSNACWPSTSATPKTTPIDSGPCWHSIGSGPCCTTLRVVTSDVAAVIATGESHGVQTNVCGGKTWHEICDIVFWRHSLHTGCTDAPLPVPDRFSGRFFSSHVSPKPWPRDGYQEGDGDESCTE